MEKEILINPGIMTLVSFVAMYLLLCTMIDGQRFLNQYRSTLNAGNDDDRDGRHSIDHNGGCNVQERDGSKYSIRVKHLLTVLLVLAIRHQTAVGDSQFLRP